MGLRPLKRIVGISMLAAGLLLVPLARGERTQYGTLIVSLGGELSPLTLPRDQPAPVAVKLEGSLRNADGSPLPRVTRVELALPQQGVLSTYGLPTCTQRKLRTRSSKDALAACRSALVGRGRAEMTVQIPNQEPFAIHLRLLAFNARVGEKRAVLLHAYTAEPPLAVVLPFLYIMARAVSERCSLQISRCLANGHALPGSRWCFRTATAIEADVVVS